jgi:hypothetical protein
MRGREYGAWFPGVELAVMRRLAARWARPRVRRGITCCIIIVTLEESLPCSSQ